MLSSCSYYIQKIEIIQNILLDPGFLTPKSKSRYRFPSALELSLNFLNVVQKSLDERLERWTYARPNQVILII